MRFKHFLGECDSKEWISPELVCEETEEKYHLIISLLNMEELTGEKEYYINVSATLLSVIDKNIDKIMDFCGWEDAPREEIIGAGWEYGFRASLWQEKGQNPMELMKYAVEAAKDIARDFCSSMDETRNALYHSGWYVAGKRD